MRVLVTGARGFVGRHLVARIESQGGTVVPVDREEADVCDADAVGRIVQKAAPDAVVHLAGQSGVARSFDDPVSTFRANVVGTVSVLEAVRCHAAAARVIVASSADAYGAVDPGDLPVVESHPLAPASPYAASKAAQEITALQYHRGFGIDVVVTRSFNAIGPGQSTDFALASFASQLAAIAHGVAEPELRVGNLDAERDLTDVRDVARAYSLLIERAESGGVYNICSERAVSIRSVLDVLIEITGLDVRIIVDAARLRRVDVHRLVGSARRINEATGWQPEYSIRQSVNDLYHEHLQR